MLDAIGWVATAVFTGSYLCKDPAKLRWIQALAAGLWVGYGVRIHSRPVVVANLLVASVAVGSTLLGRRDPSVAPPENESAGVG